MDSAGINKPLPARKELPNTRLPAMRLAAPPSDSPLWKMAAGQKEKGPGSSELLAKHTHESKDININLGKATDSSAHPPVTMGHGQSPTANIC